MRDRARRSRDREQRMSCYYHTRQRRARDEDKGAREGSASICSACFLVEWGPVCPVPWVVSHKEGVKARSSANQCSNFTCSSSFPLSPTLPPCHLYRLVTSHGVQSLALRGPGSGLNEQSQLSLAGWRPAFPVKGMDGGFIGRLIGAARSPHWPKEIIM